MNSKPLQVWLVDDDASIRWVLEKALKGSGMTARCFDQADNVLTALRADIPDVLMTDIRMPGRSGLDLLKEIQVSRPGLPVIVMTAHSDLDAAVAAYQGGAFEYLPTPFDIDNVFWSHRGGLCTFDVMIEEFGLHSEALDRLALIVRAADTARLDLAPQAAGLLAASLGLSRMHKDDLVQLDASFSLYDAFYRWSRDAISETHNWPTPAGGRA